MIGIVPTYLPAYIINMRFGDFKNRAFMSSNINSIARNIE